VSSPSGAAPGALVARAFSSLGWENFAEPNLDGVAADLLWCGPDGAAEARVEGLISEVGLRPVRVGGLDQLGLVDMLVGLWFALAFGQGPRPPPGVQGALRVGASGTVTC
jgi:8-hydroxy-5-deazaflavin:NADPH oxidoreductase